MAIDRRGSLFEFFEKDPSPSSTVAAPLEGRLRDRVSGDLVAEPIFGEGSLRWLYEHPLRHGFAPLVTCYPFVSWLYGRRMKHPKSRAMIEPFAETFGVKLDEAIAPEDGFKTFNDFFVRRLKPAARPFASEPFRLPCPADGRIRVYPTLPAHGRLPIKGCEATLAELMGGSDAARPYEGGSSIVVRLAVQDAHRFHFPVDGHVGPSRAIAGRYHSVGPIALRRVPDVLVRNKRALTEVKTTFGRLAYLEVGALTVGSIHQTYSPGPVSRGQEKGYFSFGGSTIVLAFEAGAVTFDADLVRDSAEGIEVIVRAGEPIGRIGP